MKISYRRLVIAGAGLRCGAVIPRMDTRRRIVMYTAVAAAVLSTAIAACSSSGRQGSSSFGSAPGAGNGQAGISAPTVAPPPGSHSTTSSGGGPGGSSSGSSPDGIPGGPLIRVPASGGGGGGVPSGGGRFTGLPSGVATLYSDFGLQVAGGCLLTGRIVNNQTVLQIGLTLEITYSGFNPPHLQGVRLSDDKEPFINTVSMPIGSPPTVLYTGYQPEVGSTSFLGQTVTVTATLLTGPPADHDASDNTVTVTANVPNFAATLNPNSQEPITCQAV